MCEKALLKLKHAELLALLNSSVQEVHHELYPDQFKPYSYKSKIQFIPLGFKLRS